MMKIRSKSKIIDNYYLDIAEKVIVKSCVRNNYGAAIVNGNKLISTGYTAAPNGWEHCSSLGCCRRRKLNLPSGSGYDQCRSVHAEWRALLLASPEDCKGATLYLVGVNARNDQYVDDNEPCLICKRLIIEAGIQKVVMRDTKEKYRVVQVSTWIQNDSNLMP